MTPDRHYERSFYEDIGREEIRNLEKAAEADRAKRKMPDAIPHTVDALLGAMPSAVKDQTLIELARKIAMLEGNDPDRDALFVLERGQHIAEGVLRGESRESFIGPE